MTLNQTAQRWTWLLGLLLFCAASITTTIDASGEGIASAFNLSQQQQENPTAVLRTLAQADVVYLGETHDRPADHQAQLEIIQALHRLHPKLAIGMEMFQRPYQSVLDRYLARRLTETELQEQSQYAKRWGYDWEFYAPILRFAQAHRLPVIALNTPTEVTRKTSRTGLASLTLPERRFIPPLSAIVLEPEAYRERIQKIYAASHHGQSVSVNVEHFFQAQVLWDETMAERIAQTLQQQPKTLIVVLVGQGHLLYGDGIPARVARRMQAARSRSHFTQVSLLLNADEPEIRRDRQSADYIWHSQAMPPQP